MRGKAPTLARSVTGVQAAPLLGPAAPLAYMLAGVVMIFIGYGFVRLSADRKSTGACASSTG
jgi:amino acid transporter